MTIQSIIQESAAETLEAEAPRLVAAIKGLLETGQTPAQIGKHLRASHGEGFIQNLIVLAAQHYSHIAKDE